MATKHRRRKNSLLSPWRKQLGPYTLAETAGTSLFSPGSKSNRYAAYSSYPADYPYLVLRRTGDRTSGEGAWGGEFGEPDAAGWVPFRASTRAGLYKKALEHIEEIEAERGNPRRRRNTRPYDPRGWEARREDLVKAIYHYMKTRQEGFTWGEAELMFREFFE